MGDELMDGSSIAIGAPSEELLHLLMEYNLTVYNDLDANYSHDDATDHNPFAQPWWLEMTYATAFGSMLTVATVGNAIVIWAVLCHHVMRSPTNYFLVNVSVADLMMATGNGVFFSTYMVNSHWPFGKVFCVLSNFVANFTVALSVFSLLAISVDR